MKSTLLFFSLTFLAFVILPLIPPSSCQSMESVAEQFQLANEAYSSGRYDEAINGYTSIIAESGFSVPLLYNLGNSYAQKGASGLAILHYLRGLQLSPGNSDIQGNLELTRKNSGLFEETPTLKDRLYTLFDVNQWSIVALAALILITILLTLKSFLPLKKGWVTGGSLLLIATIIFSFSGVLQQRELLTGAVVIAPDTRLLMSPFESASAQGTIPEGSLVFSEKNHGSYTFIKDRKGRSGWIPVASLEPINISHPSHSSTPMSHVTQ